MEQIKLNKENPEMEFKLNSKDSYLLIHSVFVTSQKNFENKGINIKFIMNSYLLDFGPISLHGLNDCLNEKANFHIF